MDQQPNNASQEDINIKLEGDDKKGETKPMLKEPEAKAQPQGTIKAELEGFVGFLKTANHPGVCITHLLFRTLSVVLYNSCISL